MKIKFKTSEGQLISITRKETDPICMRVSVGGTKEVGYYLTFRGDDMQQIEDMLTDALTAFKQARKKFIQQNN